MSFAFLPNVPQRIIGACLGCWFAWSGFGIGIYSLGIGEAAAEEPWRAGFAKVEITPQEPVRMAGYGNRDHPSEGVETPLFARAAALQHSGGATCVLIGVDTIGLPGAITRDLARELEAKHGIARANVVFCSTHTHCAPDLVSELSNIFSTDLTEAELAAGQRYREQLKQGILQAAADAITKLAPAKLSFGSGSVGFAANRRVLKEGIWSGFGVQADGPVDHSLPLLRVTAPDGKLLGVLFNYACHCTTLGGDFYRIHAEWAGVAMTELEAAHADAIAICTIGCGADANPNPRTALEHVALHGRAMARELERLIAEPLTAVTEPIQSQFNYAGLSFDLPTIEELEQRTKDANPQTRRHAERMVALYREEGRLPATYPVPIQSWQFGDQLTMVFIGGEVVVDYCLRLKRELENPNLWVTAYANDVLGYIASERMRKEKGYEYDRSAIFYSLPGPWAGGTEDLLITRIHELLKGGGLAQPLAPEAARASYRVPVGYQLQLVAAEPLVQDPINIAFGLQGELWVVEMGDYPLGTGDEKGGGRVKRLVDDNQDGVFDRATMFLEGLDYPTGVYPWRDGVIISAAPDIFFARDSNGDGVADEREVLYTGFALANPQHRINGFVYGLDHSLQCASGDNLGELTAVKTGDKVNASGRDPKLFPDRGTLEMTSGRTQYIRSRNDWGDWYGNDNSHPMWHFVIEESYLKRNPAVKFGSQIKHLFNPPTAPPVFPASTTVDRFNDLYAANRFTSACSATIFRSHALCDPLNGSLFVCEPVHNLVHHSEVVADGASYSARRTASETQREFLASSDPWARPVRVTTGTDGMLWVVDMYRLVIEHPEWIPQAWQQQLDVRSGANLGRIYRLIPKNAKSVALPKTGSLDDEDLVNLLEADAGPLRDLAQQQLIHRDARRLSARVKQIAAESKRPEARVHALWLLHHWGMLDEATLRGALQNPHAGIVRNAIQLSQSRMDQEGSVAVIVEGLIEYADPAVRLQVALALGESQRPESGAALAALAASTLRNADVSLDRYVLTAILSSAKDHAGAIFKSVLAELPKASESNSPPMIAFLADLMLTAKAASIDILPQVDEAIATAPRDAQWVMPLVAATGRALKPKPNDAGLKHRSIYETYQAAQKLVIDPKAPLLLRLEAARLFGLGFGELANERTLLLEVITPQTPIELQLAAIEQLAPTRDRAAAEAVLDRWPAMSQRLRDGITSHLLAQRNWNEVLLERLEQGKLKLSDFSISARQQLRHSGTRSMQVRADRLIQDSSEGAGQREQVQLYLKQVDAKGDVSRGEAVFKKHCAVCHVADAEGRAVGPSLANLTNRTDRALLESILDPNSAVDPQYRGYAIALGDGRTITGVIAEEVGSSVTVAQADGKRLVIDRSEIDELRNTGMSLMPEGFQKEILVDAMSDLLAYLRAGVK